MSVREYVGARYVPKFADPVEWQSDTSYEALTIVTYNNSSYTSKVPVPATVGNPAQNIEYWVLTGNYNAQTQEAITIANTAKDEAETASATAEEAKAGIAQAEASAKEALDTANSVKTKYDELLAIGYKNIKYYGDDTATAIKDSLTAQGYAIIPNGEYTIDGIDLTGLNGAIIGESRNKTIIKTDTKNAKRIFISDADIEIRNITFDGLCTSTDIVSSASDTHNTLCVYNGNCIIDNIKVINGCNSNLYINGSKKIEISNVTADTSWYSSNIVITHINEEQNCTITNCQSYNSSKDGFTIAGININIANCIAGDNGKMYHRTTEPSCGIYVADQAKCVAISNCTCYNNTFAGIEFTNGASYNSTVSNCILYNNHQIGIWCDGSNIDVSNCLFANNNNVKSSVSLTDVDTMGIYVGAPGGSTTVSGVNITGCTFVGDQTGMTWKYGVQSSSSANGINVIGNSCTGNIETLTRYDGTVVGDKVRIRLRASSDDGISFINTTNAIMAQFINESGDQGSMLFRSNVDNIVLNNTSGGDSIKLTTNAIQANSELRLPYDRTGTTENGSVYLDGDGFHVYYNGALHTLAWSEWT